MSQDEQKIGKWGFVLWGFIILMVIGVVGELRVLGTVLLGGMALACIVLLAIKSLRMKMVNMGGAPIVLKHGTKRWLLFVMIFSLLMMGMKIDERGVLGELKQAHAAWKNGEHEKAAATYEELFNGSKSLLGLNNQKIVIARLIAYYDAQSNERLAKQYAEEAYQRGYELRFADEQAATFYDQFLAQKKAEKERQAREQEQLALEKEIASASVYDALSMAKVFIKQKLKNPKSADFGRQRADDCVKELGKGWYVVNMYVDATNSFGAIVRNRFSVTLRYIGDDEWGCSSIIEQ
ncbi:hypothetical protein JD969_03860 [Planctomycetota bacterium]|nr:hypothetical protein JD969_03860 [Planctomycetota bacterium]